MKWLVVAMIGAIVTGVTLVIVAAVVYPTQSAVPALAFVGFGFLGLAIIGFIAEMIWVVIELG